MPPSLDSNASLLQSIPDSHWLNDSKNPHLVHTQFGTPLTAGQANEVDSNLRPLVDALHALFWPLVPAGGTHRPLTPAGGKQRVNRSDVSVEEFVEACKRVYPKIRDYDQE